MVSDKLLPTDDRSWELKPTPITSQMRKAFAMQGMDDATMQAMIAQAKAASLEMQKEIDDCLVESNWHGEVRQVIEDSAKTGSGVLKGPYPKKKTVRMYRDDGTGNKAMVSASEITPATKRIDHWYFWPVLIMRGIWKRHAKRALSRFLRFRRWNRPRTSTC